jgi:hypothetical protein
MTLTKSDVARRQLVTAIRLFFSNGDPVSVYTLASNAWEVIDELCRLRGVDSASDQTRTHLDAPKDLKKNYINAPYRNFFKHANKDPDGKVTDFDAVSSEGVLFLAAEDYTRLNKKSPIEMQVYSYWFCAKYPEKLSPSATELLTSKLQTAFPGIADAERTAQLAMGSRAIAGAIKDPTVMNDPRTEQSL